MIDPFRSSAPRSPPAGRWLGVPLLFAVGYSAVGFSLYFSLGLVADRGLGLTPLIFLGVGLVFLLNAMTYVEGEAMLPEPGGRRDLRSGGVQERAGLVRRRLGDPDRLHDRDRPGGDLGAPLPDSDWSGFTDAGGEILTAGLVIALVAGMAVGRFTGIGRPRLLTTVAISGVLLLVAVIAVGC